MSNIPTFKIHSLYVAYAPELDLGACGACEDEALNNLTDKIRDHRGAGQGSEEDVKP